MPNYPPLSLQDDVILPEGIIGEQSGQQIIHDKYEILSDVRAGEEAGAYNYPTVQIPSAVGLSHHGGSHGFDPHKPFSVLGDKDGHKFVMGDLSVIPPEVMAKISQEAYANLNKQGTRQNAGRVIATIMEKYFASTYADGTKLEKLNTWVNDGHDPAQRPVKLPPPAVMRNLPIRKEGKAMSHYFGTTPPSAAPGGYGQGMPSHMNFAMGMNNDGSTFGPARPANPAAAARPPAPQRSAFTPPPPARTMPLPDKTVIFHLGAGQMTSNFHVVQTCYQPTWLPNDRGQYESVDIEYLVLVRNNSGQQGGDRFVPASPAPGNRLGVTLQDGTFKEIAQITLHYQVGPVDHIVMLVMPEAPVPVAPPEDYPQPEADPMPAIGEPAPMTAEEAVAQMG